MKRIIYTLLSALAAWFTTARAQTGPDNPCEGLARFEYRVDGNKVQFYSVPANLNYPLHHAWNFGDGNSVLNEANPLHEYKYPGVYRVVHSIKDEQRGCHDSSVQEIRIEFPVCYIEPAFEWKADSLNPLIIYFRNTSSLGNALPANAHVHWSFGDGTESNDWNTKHQFEKAGEYEVCLKIDLGNDCIKELCKKVTVTDCRIQPGFEIIRSTDNPLKIGFHNTSSPATFSNVVFYWEFGDGTSSNEVSPVHEYKERGYYRVCLTMKVVNSDCKKEICKTISVPECLLEPNFEYRADSANALKIYFRNETKPELNSSANDIRVNWDFGDGSSSSGWNTYHKYEKPGIYKVCLTVALSNTCVKEICKLVIVDVCRGEPKFSWKIDELHPFRGVKFFNETITPAGMPLHAKWNFGDGTGSTEWSPLHQYEKPGEYKVCLTVEFFAGCVKEICRVVTVPRPPCAYQRVDFEWRLDDNNPLRGVQFINKSTHVDGYEPKAKWSFGDGEGSNEWSPFHKYAVRGEYRVCLAVEFYPGCVKDTCKIIRIPGPALDCEKLSHFKYRVYPDAANAFAFVPEYKNPNWLYVWTFGDGTGSREIETKHQYKERGKYTVCLTVYRSDHCASTTCKEITVGILPCDETKVEFDYVRSTDAPNKIKFITNSNQPIIRQRWTIMKVSGPNDQLPVVLYEENPTYTFRDTGTYSVCLRAITANGCIKEYCERIRIEKTVGEPCVIQVYPNPADSYIEFKVELEASQLITVNIIDVTGVRRATHYISGVPGVNYIKIPVGTLPSGYYYLEVIRGNQICHAKFRKA